MQSLVFFSRAMRAAAVACAIVTLPMAAYAQTIGANAGATQSTVVFPGSTVTVPVNIDISGAGGANIASLSSGVAWSVSRLTFNSITTAGLFGTFTTTNAAAGSISFVSSNTTALGATGTLANLSFTASNTLGGTRV